MELELRFDGIILENRMMLLHRLSLDIVKKPIGDIRRIYNKWAATLSPTTPPLIEQDSRDSLEITIPEMDYSAYDAPQTIRFIPQTIRFIREPLIIRDWAVDMSSLNFMDYIRTMTEETDLGENDLSAIMVEDDAADSP